MEKRLIEEMLEDIAGDDGLLDLLEKDKQAIGVLLYLYNNQIEAVAGEGWKDEPIERWLEELGFEEYVNVPSILNRLRDLSILSKDNRFRKKKDSDSGILWILFASTLRGTLECSFSDGDYRFKITKKGEREVEAMMKHKNAED